LFAIIELLHGSTHGRMCETRIAQQEDVCRICFAKMRKSVCARRGRMINAGSR
jgi:hypothetical protein